MNKIVLTFTLACVCLQGSLSAAAQQSKDKFELTIPAAIAVTTGYKTVLLNLNDTDRLTGKTFKQLIDGDEQSTGYEKDTCILSLVFTQTRWSSLWGKHIYHSSLLLDHSILQETVYNVPGSSISDPFHIGEVLKYAVTIYASKNEGKYVIWPIGDEYLTYVD